MKPGKKVAVTTLIVLGFLALVLLLTRIWPLLPLSSRQNGMQARMQCWVKVVNQNNIGVKGYKCRVVEEHIPFWPFSLGKDTVRVFETDDDGMFEYVSKGPVVRVFVGYPWDSQWILNAQHLAQKGDQEIRTLASEWSKGHSETEGLGSKVNPYLIHVFSVSPPQRLLYWKQNVKLQDESSYLCVDILNGRVSESSQPRGDISVRDNPPTENNIHGQCLYSFVGGDNCRLYPVVDDWGLAPPENGYKKELCGSRDWQELRKQAGGDYAVYFRVSDVSHQRYLYGRLVLGGSGRAQDGEIVLYMNLQGERNLFYKGYTELPYQEIRDYVPPPVQ